ncbi:PaaI family thioesterase [Tomitella biformata]|uniref:PaaI family thioesterase n=1 Tax=Tomitella biformata TaxID=630403 RepID=UPI000464FF40|nr:hotdog domain-containing protein [Tomitella biformata]
MSPSDRPASAGIRGTGEDVAAWDHALTQYRRLADGLATACPTAAQIRSVTAALSAVADQLEASHAPEARRFAGRSPSLPGRGHPLLAPMTVDEESAHSMRGRVTFNAAFSEGSHIVHGGTQPLLFDEALGVLAAQSGHGRIRTAALTVNYRVVTPTGVELHVDATIDSVQGRKIVATGRLWHGETLLADASALFIKLRDDQP